jgi:hypothetical protein
MLIWLRVASLIFLDIAITTGSIPDRRFPSCRAADGEGEIAFSVRVDS